VHLRPPAVVRLERALAHWDSRSFGKLSSIKGRHVARHVLEGMGAANMAQPVYGTGDPRTGQTEPLRGVKHRDFHNAPTAGDLGCGKSRSAGRLRGLVAATEWGNRTATDVHTLWTNLWTTCCG
jgi:hypothetical protein